MTGNGCGLRFGQTRSGVPSAPALRTQPVAGSSIVGDRGVQRREVWPRGGNISPWKERASIHRQRRSTLRTRRRRKALKSAGGRASAWLRRMGQRRDRADAWGCSHRGGGATTETGIFGCLVGCSQETVSRNQLNRAVGCEQGRPCKRRSRSRTRGSLGIIERDTRRNGSPKVPGWRYRSSGRGPLYRLISVSRWSVTIPTDAAKAVSVGQNGKRADGRSDAVRLSTRIKPSKGLRCAASSPVRGSLRGVDDRPRRPTLGPKGPGRGGSKNTANPMSGTDLQDDRDLRCGANR